jgi:hypothetical protein
VRDRRRACGAGSLTLLHRCWLMVPLRQTSSGWLWDEVGGMLYCCVSVCSCLVLWSDVCCCPDLMTDSVIMNRAVAKRRLNAPARTSEIAEQPRSRPGPGTHRGYTIDSGRPPPPPPRLRVSGARRMNRRSSGNGARAGQLSAEARGQVSFYLCVLQSPICVPRSLRTMTCLPAGAPFSIGPGYI